MPRDLLWQHALAASPQKLEFRILPPIFFFGTASGLIFAFISKLNDNTPSSFCNSFPKIGLFLQVETETRKSPKGGPVDSPLQVAEQSQRCPTWARGRGRPWQWWRVQPFTVPCPCRVYTSRLESPKGPWSLLAWED